MKIMFKINEDFFLNDNNNVYILVKKEIIRVYYIYKTNKRNSLE